MEYYIKILADEGITSVAIWQSSSNRGADSNKGSTDNQEDSTSSQVARLHVKDSSTNAEDNDGSVRLKVNMVIMERV